MKNSRLIKILKTFSKEEFREFEKFTASPYFSTGRNLVPFLNILKKYYPAFDSDEFTNEKIFSGLFPGKKFNEKNLPLPSLILLKTEKLRKKMKFFLSDRLFLIEKKIRELLLMDNSAWLLLFSFY